MEDDPEVRYAQEIMDASEALCNWFDSQNLNFEMAIVVMANVIAAGISETYKRKVVWKKYVKFCEMLLMILKSKMER